MSGLISSAVDLAGGAARMRAVGRDLADKAGGRVAAVQNFARKTPNHVSVAATRIAERNGAMAGVMGLGRARPTQVASDVHRGRVLILHNGVDHAHRYPHLMGEIRSLGSKARLARLSSVDIDAAGALTIRGKQTPMPDAIIARPVTDRDLALLTKLERSGVFVVDSPGSLRAANSKAELAGVFAKHGVPSPETEVVVDRAGMDAAAARLGLDEGTPVVLKTDKDSGGRGVWLARTREEYDALAPTVLARSQSRDEPAIVQRFHEILPEPGVPRGTGVDRRILVSRNQEGVPEAFAGYMRVARGNDFRANGGALGNVYTRLDPSGSTSQLTHEELRIAEQAVAAAGVDYAGVDIMRTSGGPVAIEINPTPGTPELDLRLPRQEHALPRLARWAVQGTRPS